MKRQIKVFHIFCLLTLLLAACAPAAVGEPILGDFTWRDVNNNGVQDPGEEGLGNVAITLYSSTGEQVAQTKSDPTGYYAFADVPAGDYYLVFDPPADYRFSPMDATDDDKDSDADPRNGQTAVFTVDPTVENLDWDAGFYEVLEATETPTETPEPTETPTPEPPTVQTPQIPGLLTTADLPGYEQETVTVWLGDVFRVKTIFAGSWIIQRMEIHNQPLSAEDANELFFTITGWTAVEAPTIGIASTVLQSMQQDEQQVLVQFIKGPVYVELELSGAPDRITSEFAINLAKMVESRIPETAFPLPTVTLSDQQDLSAASQYFKHLGLGKWTAGEVTPAEQFTSRQGVYLLAEPADGTIPPFVIGIFDTDKSEYVLVEYALITEDGEFGLAAFQPGKYECRVEVDGKIVAVLPFEVTP